MKILIIEDEKDLSESITVYLRGEDYICESAADFTAAMEKTDMHTYDCILLDLTLPVGNGLEILKELKKNKKTDGVLVISAKNAITDKVSALNLGADDYLAKPFHLSELSARISAIIRRKNFEGNNLIRFNDISIDVPAKLVTIKNKTIDLTKKEYQLLLYFITNKRRVISKNAIAEHLWGDEMPGNYDFIYTHIKNLRKKIMDAANAEYIKSVYGMGYKFTD